MKKIFFLTIIISSVLSGMEAESLQRRCVGQILKDPRGQIHADLEHRLPADRHDDIRQEWHQRYKESPWLKNLVVSNNGTQVLGSGVEKIAFNLEQDRIRTKSSYVPRCAPNFEPIYFISKQFNLDGTPVDAQVFLRERRPNVVIEKDLHSLGLDNVWTAACSEKNKKIIGIKAGALGILHDYAPGERFEEYIAKRAPLAQILLLEALQQAHQNDEKISLTFDEKKILDGMPPQFEKAKELLRKSVR